MLALPLITSESFDEETNSFVSESITIRLEHSLVSVSKWESIWEVPFLVEEEHTSEQIESYVKCMIVGDELSPELFAKLDETHYSAINEYIGKKMTATWFSELQPEPKSGETITSELIYYWLVALQIPWEAQHWNLNRLFTLIKVCNLKNADPKKMTKGETMARHRKLLAERRAQIERDKKGGTS